ncbi:MAG: hypothetical protein ACK56W_19870 [Pirellula sp.]|nr:hypothetical protein [Pirellula sp.]
MNLEITQIHSVMEMPLRGNGIIGEAKNDAGKVAWDQCPELMDLRLIATMFLAYLDA